VNLLWARNWGFFFLDLACIKDMGKASRAATSGAARMNKSLIRVNLAQRFIDVTARKLAPCHHASASDPTSKSSSVGIRSVSFRIIVRDRDTDVS
jgi:hypothetical protein